MATYPLIAACFDPGVTTGHAVATVDAPGKPIKIRSGQTRFDHIMLFQQLELLRPQFVVCEGFEYRNRKRTGLILYPVELIGVIHLWAQLSKTPLYMQKAMEGKSYYSDKMIKDAKLWLPGKPHAMDAVRHLLHWFTFGYGYQFNTNGFERG